MAGDSFQPIIGGPDLAHKVTRELLADGLDRTGRVDSGKQRDAAATVEIGAPPAIRSLHRAQS